MNVKDCKHCPTFSDLEMLADPEVDWGELLGQECGDHPCPGTVDGEHHINTVRTKSDASDDAVIRFRCGGCGVRGSTSIEPDWIYWS